MAILTDSDLVEVRRKLAEKLKEVRYTKSELTTIFQKLEDWWESKAAEVNTAITVAVPTKTWIAQEKAAFLLAFLFHKAGGK